MTRPDDDANDDATRLYDRERVLTAHVSERLLDAAGVGRGHRVLDVACGRGEPALRAAHRVGPAGRVVAVDVDPVVVRVCAARAAAAGLPTSTPASAPPPPSTATSANSTSSRVGSG